MHDAVSEAKGLPSAPEFSASSGPGRDISHRPPGYPSAFVWLRAGVLRDWRGVLGAFLATWFYVPLALLVAVLAAVAFGFAGLLTGLGTADEYLPPEVRDLPLVGSLLDSFLTRSGGAIGGILGAGVGFLGGFLAVVVLPWQQAFDNPVSLMASVAGVMIAAALVGLLYTLYRVLLEPRLLTVSGARQLSRREAAKLIPILLGCAQRLGLPNVPRLLIEDDPVLTNARAYARHIVVSTALLTEPEEEIAALLSHELVHWRTGDEVTSAFVRGVALPLFLIHAVPTWLMRSFPHPATNFVVFVLFWPVLLTMKYLVVPLQARDIRAAEYRADLGAVFAGHVDGMRAMLEKRKAFESGRSGWDEAVCATHPANELRLDRLETASPALVAGVAGPSSSTTTGPSSLEELFGAPGSLGSQRSWLIAAAVVAVLCLGSAVIGVVQWGFFRPQVAVDGYFTALSEHDSDAALEWLSPAARETAAKNPLITAMVRSPDYQPPTAVAIKSMDTNDKETATAEVSLTIAGASMTGTLTLARDESAILGVLRGWHIVDGLSTLTIAGGQPGLHLNGVDVEEITQSPEQHDLVVLPGSYLVTARANPLTEMPPRRVVAAFGEEDSDVIQPTGSLQPTAQTRANEAIKKYLDDCVRQQVAEPGNCPFSYSDGVVQKIKWEIVEYPRVEITLESPTTARVSTPYDDQGRVRVAGTYRSFSGMSVPFSEEYSFDVEGNLSVTGDQLAFYPDN